MKTKCIKCGSNRMHIHLPISPLACVFRTSVILRGTDSWGLKSVLWCNLNLQFNSFLIYSLYESYWLYNLGQTTFSPTQRTGESTVHTDAYEDNSVHTDRTAWKTTRREHHERLHTREREGEQLSLLSLSLSRVTLTTRNRQLTSGGSIRKRATMMPSCSTMRRKAMMSWAQADMKRGFFVQIFFLLPARIRAMRFVYSHITTTIRTF